MEWIPVVLITFKLLIFGVGMFYAIKWHRDQELLKRQREREAAERAAAAGAERGPDAG